MSVAGDGTLNYRFYANDGSDVASGTAVDGSTVEVITATTVRPSGGDYATIDAAWDAASSDENIIVYPNADFTAATYTGKIWHWDPKTNINVLSACGPDLTIASGGNANDYVFSLQGNQDGAVIDGFTVTGATGSGIYSNGDSMTIRNCKIHDNNRGVWPNNTCDSVIIEDSFIYDNTTQGLYSNYATSGLTISDTEFTNNGNGTVNGAALYCKGSGHVFTNLTMTGNDGNQGGAIFSDGCSFTIDDSVINSNTADTTGGGGFYIQNGGSITITDTSINNNVAGTVGGGAIYVNNGAITITDTFIQGNSATGKGGAIYYNTGTGNNALLTNIIMTGNKSTDDGGAIFNNNAYTDCTFCTISGNYSGDLGGGVYISNNYTSTFKNSIIYNNDALNGTYKQIYTNYRWSYTDVYSTLINQSPGSSSGDERLSYEDMGGNDTTTYSSGAVFVSRQEPASAPTSAGDYHIISSSACVDAASASYTSDHDIYGDVRPVDGPDVDADAEYDMGADEYVP